MDNAKTLNKEAVSQEERNKIIKGAILAAAAAATTGAIIRDTKAKKDRKKAMDPYGNKNAIVIPIKKTKFMEGLPTPEELSATRSEAVPELTNAEAIPMLENKQDSSALSSDQIAAMKKDILRSRARSLNFFGKRAEEESNGDKPESKADNPKPESDKVTKEEDDKGRVFFRDETGKFVSPTDPVAVEQVAKEAEDEGFWSNMNPVNFVKSVGRAAMDRPLVVTGGGLAAIYLAAKISDAINERRRNRSKERLDEARDEYVSLVQDAEEKKADADDAIGNLAGYAFFVPAALTAVITHKIIENRKEEKKKQKEQMDSYPEEPAILYKTSEGKDLEIDAESALMGLMFKQAMIMDVERMEAEAKLEKSAAMIVGTAPIPGNPNTGEDFSEDEIRNAVDYSVKHMTDEKNRSKLLKLVEAYNGDPKAKGYHSGVERAFGDMLPGMLGIGMELPKGMTPARYKAIMQDPRARALLAGNQKLQDTVMGNFANNDEWIKYKNNQIDDYFANNWKLQKGGLLHTILSWIAKNLGIGDWMANRKIRNLFGRQADKYKSIQAQKDQQAAEAAEARRQQDENSFAQHELAGSKVLRDLRNAGDDVASQMPSVVDASAPQVGPTSQRAAEQNRQNDWRAMLTTPTDVPPTSSAPAVPGPGEAPTAPAITPPAPPEAIPEPSLTEPMTPPPGTNATNASRGGTTVIGSEPPNMPAPSSPRAPTPSPSAQQEENVLAPFGNLLPWHNWK